MKVIEHLRNNKAWSMPIKLGNKEGTRNFGGSFSGVIRVEGTFQWNEDE